jgi:hypothetical protein
MFLFGSMSNGELKELAVGHPFLWVTFWVT